MHHRSHRPHVAVAAALGGLALLLSAVVAQPAQGRERSEGGAVPRGRELARVELGRRLFFDPLVSRSGLRACASCHDPEHGFSDPRRVSRDDFLPTPRHSQTLVDAGLSRSAHWDGEFASVEELVAARLGVPSGESSYGGSPTTPGRAPVVTLPRPTPPGPVTPRAGRVRPTAPEPPGPRPTLDLRALPRVHDVVEEHGRYTEAFRAAFGSAAVNTSRLAEALGAYVRTIRSTESPFDRFRAGETEALGAEARLGLALFQGRAGCATCHRMDGRRPRFTDDAFHNTGVAWQTVVPHVETAAPELALHAMDPGRARISTNPAEQRAFKTPTLRDVALRAPYMHDGRFDTLEDVVRYYAVGGSGDPALSEHVQPVELDEREVRAIAAFLRSLTGEVRPGLAPTLWRARADETTLRFVDGHGRPLADLAVTLRPEGDVLPGDLPRTSPVQRLVTDAGGRIHFVPPHRSHVRLVLADDLPVEGGPLVPDTCRRARIVVPVRGAASLALRASADRHLPETIRARHRTDLALPEANQPVTVLRRIGVVEVGGERIARYEGPFRTDVDPHVQIDLPGDPPALRSPVRLDAEAEATVALD